MTTEFAPEEIIKKDGKVDFVVFKGRDGESTAKVKADTVVFAVGQAAEDIAVHADGVFSGGDLETAEKKYRQLQTKVKLEAIAEYLEKKAGVK